MTPGFERTRLLIVNFLHDLGVFLDRHGRLCDPANCL